MTISTKPFEFIELTARLDALNRRRAPPSAANRDSRLRIGNLEIDLLRRSVRRGERQIDLLPREYALLRVSRSTCRASRHANHALRGCLEL